MDYICSDCPRRCGAERSDTKSGGVCASPALPRAARAAPHFGEEPCISGSRGAGTIFFTGCSLRCVYCQNRAISRGGGEGRTVSVEALRSMMLRLRDEGAHCIDLVTPTHYLRAVREALEGLALGIPVVWNSSGYESVEALKSLEGLVQVYLPDYKYSDAALAKRYSAAPDYPEIAAAAIREMYRQTGPFRMDENGLLVPPPPPPVRAGPLSPEMAVAPGHGPECMVDGDTNTWFQSAGPARKKDGVIVEYHPALRGTLSVQCGVPGSTNAPPAIRIGVITAGAPRGRRLGYVDPETGFFSCDIGEKPASRVVVVVAADSDEPFAVQSVRIDP